MGMSIQSLFERAIEMKASDLLLTSGSPAVLRIDGELRLVDSTALTNDELHRMVCSLLSAEQVQRLTKRRELDFAVQLNGSHRFRGNAFFTRHGIAANYRLLSTKIPTLQELTLPGILEEIALERQGLVLITGPTGHGKSTTLASMIEIINRNRRAHIVTIEDPIEYVYENRLSIVNQREVGSDTMSFTEALRHVLRQNPDVLLVGELRDLETISMAVTAAETGHLVLSTLHTNDAAQTVDRLIDVFPSHQQSQVRTQLSLCLLAVLSQRLLPRKEGTGRIPATELLRRTYAISNMIRDGNTHQINSVLETQSRLSMHTMDNSIKRLYTQGLITLETARQHVRDLKSLGALE